LSARADAVPGLTERVINRPNALYLHPDGARVRLSRHHCGLVQSAGTQLALVGHAGDRLLRRGARGSANALLFNTDQGSRFTSIAFTGVLLREKIAISVDGKGAWRDNVIVERLWRSVKYEEVYLRAYTSVPEARASLGRYLTFYDSRRPHSSLDRRTPDQAYFN
jgi:transposase InsO family protein